MRGFANHLKRSCQRGDQRRAAREFDHCGQVVLLGNVPGLANGVRHGLVIVRGDLPVGGAGAVNPGAAEGRELLAAFLPGLHLHGEACVFVPKILEDGGAGNQRQSQIGDHAFGGRDVVGLQEFVQATVGDLDIFDPGLGPAFQRFLVTRALRGGHDECTSPIFPGAALIAGTSPANGAARGARSAVRRESMSFTISPFAAGLKARGDSEDLGRRPVMMWRTHSACRVATPGDARAQTLFRPPDEVPRIVSARHA